MAPLTAEAPALVRTWNWKPVDPSSTAARYWPVSWEAPSTRILVRAWAGGPGMVVVGQRVKTPGRTCICCGNGISAGVAAKAALASNASTTAKIG